MGMTIDEVIKNADELAKLNEDQAQIYKEQGETMGSWSYDEGAKRHRQVAEWLKELKKYQAIFEKVGKILADNGYTMDDLDNIFGKVNGEVNADDE